MARQPAGLPLGASCFTFARILSPSCGWLAFQAPDDVAGPLAQADTTFALADDEATAMKEPDGPSQTLLMYFNQSLRGLSPGAPVDFRGITIGEVKSIGVQFDRSQREFLMPVCHGVPHLLAGRTARATCPRPRATARNA